MHSIFILSSALITTQAFSKQLDFGLQKIWFLKSFKPFYPERETNHTHKHTHTHTLTHSHTYTQRHTHTHTHIYTHTHTHT